jgi:hypothetical protein
MFFKKRHGKPSLMELPPSQMKVVIQLALKVVAKFGMNVVETD